MNFALAFNIRSLSVSLSARPSACPTAAAASRHAKHIFLLTTHTVLLSSGGGLEPLLQFVLYALHAYSLILLFYYAVVLVVVVARLIVAAVSFELCKNMLQAEGVLVFISYFNINEKNETRKKYTFTLTVSRSWNCNNLT